MDGVYYTEIQGNYTSVQGRSGGGVVMVAMQGDGGNAGEWWQHKEMVAIQKTVYDTITDKDWNSDDHFYYYATSIYIQLENLGFQVYIIKE